MICTGCGKDIPFAGEVCPYCQRNKSDDQQQVMAAFIVGIAGGLLGYLIGGGGGLILGFIIGAVIGFVSVKTKSEPPEVRVRKEPKPASPMPSAHPVPEPQPKGKLSAEERLGNLKELLDKGFLTNAEYEAKRKSIVDDL